MDIITINDRDQKVYKVVGYTVVMAKVYDEITELFGSDRCDELEYFMRERSLVPVSIVERPKMDDRNRYLIKTKGSKVKLSDDSSVGASINIYVTYNPRRNIFTYMEYLSQPL